MTDNDDNNPQSSNDKIQEELLEQQEGRTSSREVEKVRSSYEWLFEINKKAA